MRHMCKLITICDLMRPYLASRAPCVSYSSSVTRDAFAREHRNSSQLIQPIGGLKTASRATSVGCVSPEGVGVTRMAAARLRRETPKAEFSKPPACVKSDVGRASAAATNSAASTGMRHDAGRSAGGHVTRITTAAHAHKMIAR